MEDDILDSLMSIHSALASAQQKVVTAMSKQRLSPDNRDQLVLEINWILKRVQNAPN